MIRFWALTVLAVASVGCDSKPSKPALAANPSAVASASNAGSPIVATGSIPAIASGGPGVAPNAASALVAHPFIAGYGGVGPATPAPRPDTWAVLLIDVKASSALHGVELVELSLLDKGGTLVARGKLEHESTRRDTSSGDARRKGDFSQLGTVPFNGVMDAGQSVRLYLNVALDTRSESLVSQPVRFRVRVVAPGDPGVWVEGPLQPPWPTG